MYYRIIKYGRNAWYIIEPTRQLLLRNEEGNDLLRFWSKEQALTYCKENNLEVAKNMHDKLSFNEMKSEVEEITRQQLGCYNCMYFRECEFPCKGGPRL